MTDPKPSILRKPAHWLRTRSKWQSRFVAFALGILLVGAHAPFFLWPLALIALTSLVWLFDGAAKTTKPIRNGAWLAWYFGLGQFLAGLYWIGFAFSERGAAYVPMIPFAVFFLAAGLALFWMAAGAVALRFWSRRSSRVLVFALSLFAAEWLRGHVLTGLPWNLPGLIWPAGGAISQSVAWAGVWGLSLFTLLAFAAPAALVWSKGTEIQKAMPAIAGFLFFTLLFGSGLARLAAAENQTVAGVRLRVIQAQIDQSEKWDPANRSKVVDQYLDLSSAPGLSGITHLVWPEGALPLLLLESPYVLEKMAKRFADGPVLLTGLTRRETTETGEVLFRNSLAALSFTDGNPALEMIYDKHHLTPFGEYLPFGKQLAASGIKALTPLGGGFTPGPEAVTTQIPGAPPVSPQICYEAIFSGFTPGGPERPAWIVNVSNDSWFGPSTGPLQHAQQAKFRAIEEGVPVIRSASSGISGVIDPFGRLLVSAPLGENTHIDSALPKALPATFYSKFHNLGLVSWFLLMLASAIFHRRK
ncbi:Apolipoprotein N-acyltransferase / Copper homeostasis protein CutE [hydrothermal vent metagenome]|uniref:Apolipoprotein N-acyltransferase / Copper homeostasis protein CutE n=1 Tax=hydrothermal vent metagenome TaxID=652676 RepID=A0A3B0S9W0_9ZZZZ